MSAATTTSQPITDCQICGGDKLSSVLFVGYISPVNTMPAVGSVPVEQSAYPLELLRCPTCGHVQIGLEVSAEVLFPYSYPYLSGTTRILRENFAELYRDSRAVIPLASSDLVVDIGSNDGTLLLNFKEGGHRVLGIEPSRAGEVARQKGVDTLTAYFNAETVHSVTASHGKAKIITAANVFAHIAKPHDVMKALVALLDDKGVFISESHYLLPLVETLQYDTIYHEHLRYYHLGALMRLFSDHGLQIFRVKRIPTHGGSIRVYAARKGQFSIDPSVADAVEAESVSGITDGRALADFRRRVVQSKLDLHALIAPLKAKGARIFGIGAPSRASTLINYVGLDVGIVDCVLEVPGSHKIGHYIPGTRIPIVEESVLFSEQPEYALLFSWHIGDDLMQVLRRKGFHGKFIMPLPEPRIVG